MSGFKTCEKCGGRITVAACLGTGTIQTVHTCKPEWRCGSCKWWEGPEETGNDNYLAGHRYCVMASGDDRASKSTACAVDVDGYSQRLATAPDFGCVLWEAK